MTGLSKLAASPRTLAIALLATLAVLAGATWFVIIAPKRNEASSLSSQIQVAKATLEARKHLGGAVTSQPSQSLFIRRALPDAVAMPQVILELSRVAGEVNVSLDSITPSAAVAYSGFSAVPLAVVVSGRYANVESFLQEVRDQVRVGSGGISATGRLFDVQAVDIAQAATPPLVSATLNMDVFVYSGVPVTGATATAAGASG